MSGSDKFLNGQKLAQIRLSFTQDLWTRVPFEWQFKVCKFFTRSGLSRKMVTFNPELSQILTKVFLSNKMQLDVTKCC